MSTAVLSARRIESRPSPSPSPPAGGLSQLPDVTVGEIVAFVTVLRCGTFTAAAQHLHLSQPGLSARIARLERALGGILIDRSTRKLTLTPTGLRFAPVAESVVRLMVTARASGTHLC